MRGVVITCAAICGVSVGIVLAHIGIIYIENEMFSADFPATPVSVQMTGSVVAVDIPKKMVTLRIMSPYNAAESYLATVSFDEKTSFRLVNEYGTLGTAGIAKGQFPPGMRVTTVLPRIAGGLHMNLLFGSMAL